MKLLQKLRPIPGWQSEDPSVRAAAVRDLGDDRDLLVEIARHDEDPTVRREAVGRIQDIEILAAIAVDDADEVVREQARGLVRDLVIESEETAVAEPALAALPEARDLIVVARSARLESIRRAALSRLNDARALGSVARRTSHPEIAKAALARLEDPAEIEAVVLKADDKVVAVMAFERLTADSPSRDTLEGIARRAKQKAVARRAKAALVALDETLAAQTNNEADRDHVVVCQRLEAFATADGFEHGREALDHLLQRWAALHDGRRVERPAVYRCPPSGRNSPRRARCQAVAGPESRAPPRGGVGSASRPLSARGGAERRRRIGRVATIARGMVHLARHRTWVDHVRGGCSTDAAVRGGGRWMRTPSPGVDGATGPRRRTGASGCRDGAAKPRWSRRCREGALVRRGQGLVERDRRGGQRYAADGLGDDRPNRSSPDTKGCRRHAPTRRAGRGKG